MLDLTRRSFLTAAAAIPSVAPFLSRFPRAPTPRLAFDPDFGTATDAVQAIRSGAISSRELTSHVFGRIRKYNSRVNAFLTLIEDAAMKRAGEADEALARGKAWGPLHGLPILTKDAFETKGVRTTSSHKALEHYIPKEDAVAVARLKAAGAVLVGKTNMAWEAQSFNDIAGTSNNPWDLTRTPGGSTGGGGAALAAGLGFLELGSDTGGSIRIPSTFCGVYGHKPSLNVVPLEGHIISPPVPGVIEPRPDYLTVAGPLARSADDLRLELEIVGGPGPREAVAYRWELPAPRRTALRDYRIGYVADDPFCPLSSEVAEVVTGALGAMRKKRLQLLEGWPDGLDPQASYDTYMFFLQAPGRYDPAPTDEDLMYYRRHVDSWWGYYAKSALKASRPTYEDSLRESTHRLGLQATWRKYFETHDAFVMPITFVPAFHHNQSGTFWDRPLETSHGPKSMADIMKWPHVANLTGCPSTVVPAGRTQGGLPVGFQIMGPYLEDATCLDIAKKLSDVTGGFVAPPGYE